MKINGTQVIDARRPIKIVVTPGDVKRGNTKDPGACAAALACMRDLGASKARVHVGRTYVEVGGKWHRFKTAPALRDEVVAFDRGGKFMPGTYTLHPMPKSERLGKKKQTGPKLAIGRKIKKRNIVVGVRSHGANR